jgi:hypothetical protein
VKIVEKCVKNYQKILTSEGQRKRGEETPTPFQSSIAIFLFYYLPCPLYLFGFCALGPYDFLYLPLPLLPNVTFCDAAEPFAFAIC